MPQSRLFVEDHCLNFWLCFHLLFDQEMTTQLIGRLVKYRFPLIMHLYRALLEY
jgi:hypothetical protein